MDISAEELKASGINPRTKAPYVRQPYNKDRATSAAACITAHKKAEEKKEKKAATETARETSDRNELVSLREKVKRLEDLLEVEKQGKAIAISNAELKATQGTSFALLARYKDGLRDGASLSRGGSLSATTATPDSAHFAEQSPM